jgi:ketosteroid isomerase-like protein
MEYTSGGTLTGEVDFRSIEIPPSGLAYEIRCCFVFHFRNGRIDRVRRPHGEAHDPCTR